MEEKTNNETINKDISKSTDNKNKYVKFKRELEEICEYLYDSKNYINDAKVQVSKNYTLDDESADQGKLNDISGEIEDTINYIKTHLIPTINSEINDINKNITSLTDLLQSEEE